MAQDNRAGDEYYFNKALLDYEAKFGVPFTLCHCWETSGSSSFNTKSRDASFNSNVDAGDKDKNEVQEAPRPIDMDKARGSKKKGARSSGSSMNMIDEALDRLMVSELAT
ncbi:hypothetical protein Tco_0240145 [Tanacetum coccineum]